MQLSFGFYFDSNSTTGISFIENADKLRVIPIINVVVWSIVNLNFNGISIVVDEKNGDIDIKSDQSR